ncbi:MAG: phytanoyl-CoA dioxygenase family protein [Chloroflexi bacterium]|nr:phytanoyl-CoA dioxygenase family protein [Chloroflexota bacterium]
MDTDCLRHVLTAEEQEAFERDGYLRIEGALSRDHAADLVDVIDRLHRDGRLVAPATYAGVTNRVQHLNAVGLDPAFVDLIDHPTTFPKVWGILGWNIFLLNTHLMLTPPEPREGPRGPGGWHQDNGRRTLDMPELEIPARLSLKVGYFLTDVSRPDMGNFWVVPGSHRRRSIGVKPGAGGVVPGAEPVLLRAGDALIFDARVWHSGSSNYSETTRKVLFFAYAYRWLHSDNVLPPGHEARATTDPIRRQLLDIIDSGAGRMETTDETVPLRAWLTEHQPELAARYEY